MVKITRTVSLKLNNGHEAITKTFNAYIAACNHISKFAFKRKLFNPFSLQKHLYKQIRKKFGLKSQMAINALRLVASMYKSAKSNGRMKPATFKRSSILLNFPRDFKICDGKILSLNTVDGRVKILFLHGKHQEQYLDGSWEIGSGRLIKKKSGHYFNISVSKEVETKADVGSVTDIIGVDMGINHLAVATTTDKRVKFFGGGKVKNRKMHYLRIRKSLQAKGTRRARRILKRISGRERRFMADVNHCISKQIVEFACKHKTPMIALEDLTNIRERIKGHKGKQNYQMHSWAFGQLQSFIKYKAWGEGILVETVDPAYTSQMCSRCGHVLKSQRKGLNFRCESCGYTLQADLNAARNIEARLRLYRHILEGPGCLSTSPEVAGVDAKAHPERKRRNRELRRSLVASS